MEVGGHFGHEYLLARFQAIEELAVPAVQLVERPRRDADSVGQRPIDLTERDLRLDLELHLLRHVVFFRRAGSFVQSFGRYAVLSSRHPKPGAA